MNQKNFDRKQRYGIRKFAVGVASVTIGVVVFGVNPVLANEQGNSTVTAAENNNQQQSTYNYSTTDVSFSKSGNLYTSGQCTWYVYDKTGGKIGSTWGNANSWATAAQAAGFTVNNTPEEGAIMQSSEGAFGHVAFVESVNNDGSITVSEMNYDGGPFSISTRTISASEASSYNYIHLN